jgi:hypothetical protein
MGAAAVILAGLAAGSLARGYAGFGSGFSLEAPEGVRFLTRSRVFTDEEVEELRRFGPPARGDALA